MFSDVSGLLFGRLVSENYYRQHHKTLQFRQIALVRNKGFNSNSDSLCTRHQSPPRCTTSL